MHTDRTGSHTVFQWQDWDVQGSVLTWLDPWLREPAPHTQNPGHWHLLWSSHAHTSHLPLKELEKTAAQDRLTPKWWPQLTFSHFFSENSSSDCQVNEQIQQRQLLHSPTIRLTRSPLKGWFLWSTFLTAIFSPWKLLCGREKSAFVYFVSFYCYRRDNITTIISKAQSHKRANSRLKYINKW